LEKGFQFRSFDAIVAHAAVVVVRYMFLALESRENIDERSVGELFWATCDELKDISFPTGWDVTNQFAFVYCPAFFAWLRQWVKFCTPQVVSQFRRPARQ
jgi:hypothetical protein